jgi:hypothetical protein
VHAVGRVPDRPMRARRDHCRSAALRVDVVHQNEELEPSGRARRAGQRNRAGACDDGVRQQFYAQGTARSAERAGRSRYRLPARS